VEANETDPVLSALSLSRRETLVAAPEDGALRFDVRLQGPAQTTFFAV
jgi:protocatechuate 3,4-dioxygenase alpha subunit